MQLGNNNWPTDLIKGTTHKYWHGNCIFKQSFVLFKYSGIYFFINMCKTWEEKIYQTPKLHT